jgi:hypothetical protein
MAKAANMKVTDMPLRDRMRYEDFMRLKTPSMEYNGKIYTPDGIQDVLVSNSQQT